MNLFVSRGFYKTFLWCNFRDIKAGKCSQIISSRTVYKAALNGPCVDMLAALQRIKGTRQFQACSRNRPVCTFGDTRTTRAWNSVNIIESKTMQGLMQGLRTSERQAKCTLMRGSPCQFFRNFSSSENSYQQRNKTTAIYIIALVTVVLGGSYAAVPLYRIFCQASGLGGTVQQTDAGDRIKQMKANTERLVTVRFNADKSATMQWSFRPQQTEVKVYPGETALAFYKAKNPTDVPITGISTYNVIPFEAGQYFNKIQCFCFEEQRLNPHEEVDMPVFFYIDPDFVKDPALCKVDTITLSYTFFQAKEAHQLGIQ